MISRIEFVRIDTEIKKSIEYSLNELRESNQNDYALFLADGEYSAELEENTVGLNSNVIDYRIDRFKDSSRLSFLTHFLSNYYPFPLTQASTDDNQYRLHIELMVFIHIWESKPFLKKLCRLAHLLSEYQYLWKVEIPNNSKHNFILSRIKNIFEGIGSPIFQIIDYSYHSSLRNAFAHSEYRFDTMNGNRRIILDNYKGNTEWELPEISFDEWSKRFVYSALLSYHLLNLIHLHRTNLIETTGTNMFQIKRPSNKNGFDFVWITYNQEYDRFSFEQ